MANESISLAVGGCLRFKEKHGQLTTVVITGIRPKQIDCIVSSVGMTIQLRLQEGHTCPAVFGTVKCRVSRLSPQKGGQIKLQIEMPNGFEVSAGPPATPVSIDRTELSTGYRRKASGSARKRGLNPKLVPGWSLSQGRLSRLIDGTPFRKHH